MFHRLGCGVAVFLVMGLSGCGDTGSGGGDGRPGSRKAAAEDPRGTYAGDWRGPADSVAYVRSVFIEKNEFPCRGAVEVQYGTDEKYNFNSGVWEMKENNKLVGKFGIDSGAKLLEATVWVDNNLLTGQVKSPPALQSGREFNFSQYRRPPVRK